VSASVAPRTADAARVSAAWMLCGGLAWKDKGLLQGR
jgi:hypothetical protein